MTDPQNETPRDRLFLAILGWIDREVCACEDTCRPALRKVFDDLVYALIEDKIQNDPGGVYVAVTAVLRAREGNFS